MSNTSYPATAPANSAQAAVQSVVVGYVDVNGNFQPTTAAAGLPVAGGGGGGGSSLSDVLLTDSNGILFVGRDQGGTSGTIFTYYRLDTQVAYTPVGTIKAAGNNVVTVADGADVTQGAIADAVVAAGAAGTDSAKLRRLTTDIGVLAAASPTYSTTTLQTAGNASLTTLAANVGTVTPVDASGKITTGNTAQQLVAANASRRGCWIQNQSTGDLWFNELGTAVILAAGTPQSIRLPAGGYYEWPANAAPSGAISIIGATTGQQFAARTW